MNDSDAELPRAADAPIGVAVLCRRLPARG